MNRKMKKILCDLLWVSVLATVVTGCNHKALCYDHRHTSVRVEFDWSESPEADPGGMCVLFYPVDGGSPVVKEFSGSEGGRVEVPEGEYDVVCYNKDVANVLWRGAESLVTLEVYTRGSSVTEDLDGGFAVPPLSGDEISVVAAPGCLWSSRLDDVRVDSGGEESESVVVLAPRRVTRRVVWEMSSVVDSGNLAVCRAVLSGLSGSLRLGSVTPVPAAVSMPSSGIVDGEDAEKLTGSFECFGCSKDSSCRHLLTLYCWSPGGNVLASWDVTDQVHAAADTDEIRLVVTGRIEIPDERNSGFDPGVDGWDDKQGDIIM